MLADLARFFEDVNIFLAELRIGMRCIVLVNQLRQTQGAGHARGPATDDHYVRRHLRAFHAFQGFAENQHKKMLVTDLHGSPTG